MVIYTTKRLFSDGIQEIHDAYLLDFGRAGVRTGFGSTKYFGKGEWHETRAAAVEAANEMLNKRIAELERQIARLRMMVVT